MFKFTGTIITLALIISITNSCHSESPGPVYSKDFLLGNFEPSKTSNFVKVSSKYSDKKGMYLHKEAYDAFIKMYDAAQKDGISLSIVSATRNFNSQKSIWEAKWNGTRLVQGKNLATAITDPLKRAQTILLYSSMPGTSRHHWGTDVDLNNLNDSYFIKGAGAKVYKWLQENAHIYGFYQAYTAKPPRETGYEEEKWHWSYRPLSLEILRQYKKTIELDDLKGFQGYDNVFPLDFIRNYVLGINPELLP